MMIRLITFCLTLFVSHSGIAQLYFPPLNNNSWETVSPDSLGWCTSRQDSLFKLLETNNTKGFIILKDGKIAVEKYFGTFSQDSLWYWASAGKTVTAFLIGVAQQNNLLNITDSTSKYLGTGWTSCPPEKERLITIRNQLTMTTGLDYNVPDDNCTTPACLKYRADAGTQWYYHNATYLLLQDVIESASGRTLQQFTNQQLNVKTGINGGWFNGTFYSKPRGMARFGLLMLNKGIWNTDTLLFDTAYYRQMITPSQSLNESYGYLWWLNGFNSYKLPGTTFTFPGMLCKPAPKDLFSGLGKNDQKLYIWPSERIVIIRMGESASDGSLVPVVFDTLLWRELRQFICSPQTGINNEIASSIDVTKVYPNPFQSQLNIEAIADGNYVITDVQGRIIKTGEVKTGTSVIEFEKEKPGVYYFTVKNNSGISVKKIIKW